MVTRKVARTARDEARAATAAAAAASAGPKPQAVKKDVVTTRQRATGAPRSRGAAPDRPPSERSRAAVSAAGKSRVAAAPELTERAASLRHSSHRRSLDADPQQKGSATDQLRNELEQKLRELDPTIKNRFGELVWVKRASFPYWPALVLDPRVLPPSEYSSAIKELDKKVWVQLYGSRDIRQALFSAVVPWDDASHPYREGHPKTDLQRLKSLKETFFTALGEADEQVKLKPESRLHVFTTEVVSTLQAPPSDGPAEKKRRKTGTMRGGSAPIQRIVAPIASTPPRTSSKDHLEVVDSPASGVEWTLTIAQKPKDEATAKEITAKPRRSAKPVPWTVLPADVAKKDTLGANAIAPPLVVDATQNDGMSNRGGFLDSFVVKLRDLLDHATAQNTFKIMLILGQLLDERTFDKQDLERSGLQPLVASLCSSGDPNLRQVAKTVQTHLTLCAIDLPPFSKQSGGPSSETAQTLHQLSNASHKLGDSSVLRPDGGTTGRGSAANDAHSIKDGTTTVSTKSGKQQRKAAKAHATPALTRTMNDESTTDAVTTIADFSKSGQDPATGRTRSGKQMHLPQGNSRIAAPTEKPQSPRSSRTRKIVTGITSWQQDPLVPPSRARERSANSPSLARHLEQDTTTNFAHQEQYVTEAPLVAQNLSMPYSSVAPMHSSDAIVHVNAAGELSSNGIPIPLVPLQIRSNPALVIFNKDGTLLDFKSTWIGWIESQAWKLESALGRPFREPFFDLLGYNWQDRTIRSTGLFNSTAKRDLHKLAIDVLIRQGLGSADAADLIHGFWSLPSESVTCRPREDIPALFHTIRSMGIKIAICTTDNRETTRNTMSQLGVLHLVDRMSCGDDGLPMRPERIWSICGQLRVNTSDVIMVGDTPDDMILGRNAGCSLTVGVLGGASDLDTLAVEADILVPATSRVIKVLYQYAQQARVSMAAK